MEMPTISTNGGEGPAFVVVITCEGPGGGGDPHEQRIRFEGHPREWVDLWAAITDGRAYPVKPGPESGLAHCGICRAPLHAEVIEAGPAVVPDAAAVP